MRALMCEAHGEPETLVMRDVPAPEPGPGEIRIAVRAAGVNFPDALVIRNMYQRQPPLPFAPGGEAAGLIDAIGPGVTGWSIGDRVAAYALSGAFAEAMVVPASRVVPLSPKMDFETGAVFTMVYGTAFHALHDRGRLQAGETVLVLGAAGGVGLAAVEVAKAMGATVIAAASSATKLDLARAHGADDVIDYAAEDLKQAIRDRTGGRGVDVIFDPVGGSLSEAAFRSIALHGRHLVIGFAAGTIPAIPLNLPLLRQADIVGVAWGAFAGADPAGYRANADRLAAMYEAGAFRPHIGLRLPLERGGEALRAMLDRKVEGKVVIFP
ncbi:NADPH:quinone oxidoreductase family protein [Sphingomonas montanisoli]|uniref:NADPH:quinone oxidoreductase family protein n=1 Tax=Sphingomonas montanisoli TaxID=2606412 RepID=A0A5D9C1M5_9SPHN|nr:NADPH:quinone oxidoreductase family protein [Sphingomonas montanisoli]TZG24960.1 NADPH:quinone oxidoreductase family protein [Sphingomonas montanisoli]